jgi:hypothetical protein
MALFDADGIGIRAAREFTMDSTTLAAILAAAAGGAGGEMGRQAWAGLTRLVHRPFRHRPEGDGDFCGARASSGEAELADLSRAPGDWPLARRLAEVLVARGDHDDEFRQALLKWLEEAAPKVSNGSVSNVISGGRQCGPVLMGRDFNVSGGSFKVGQ